MLRFRALMGVSAVAGMVLGLAAGGATAQQSADKTAKTVVVAADGSGDFKTVQQAINVAPTDKTTRLVVHVRPGTYREKLTVPRDKGPIALLGEDAATTILTYHDYARTLGADGKEIGTSRSASTVIQADDFSAENITFENSAGPVGQAVAINVWSDRATFRKCRFLGWQDTVLVNRNRQYFEDCTIAGHVDFIFGASAAWFERCELHCRLGGSITAASTPQEQLFGYVFSHCKITAAPLEERKAQNRLTTILGRPWRPYASVTFLNTEMSDVVAPAGWGNWGKAENEKTARYAEYHSTGPGANLAARVPWSKPLTDVEAAAIAVEKVLGGWNPPMILPPARPTVATNSPGTTAVAPSTTTSTAAATVPETANATLTPARVATLP